MSRNSLFQQPRPSSVCGQLLNHLPFAWTSFLRVHMCDFLLSICTWMSPWPLQVQTDFIFTPAPPSPLPSQVLPTLVKSIAVYLSIQSEAGTRNHFPSSPLPPLPPPPDTHPHSVTKSLTSAECLVFKLPPRHGLRGSHFTGRFFGPKRLSTPPSCRCMEPSDQNGNAPRGAVPFLTAFHLQSSLRL